MQVQRSCCRRIYYGTANVESRSMARTGEALLLSVPGNAAAEMGALAVHREETTVLETHEVETAVRKRGNAAGLESSGRPGLDDSGSASERGPAAPGRECRGNNPACLEDGDTTQYTHRPRQEAAPLYVCHGHTSVIDGPRNHTPVIVRMTNATKSSTNSACTFSIRVATKTLPIRT